MLALNDILAELVKGAGLFLALFYSVSLTNEKLGARPKTRNIVNGVLFGAAAVFGMMMPLELGQGMIFDARTLFIGIGSAFGGFAVAIISSVIAILYRLSLGGVGAWAGVGVILSSAILGAVFFWLRKRDLIAPRFLNFLLFGLALHAAAIPWYFIIPSAEFAELVRSVGIGMLLTFTPATALLCTLMHEIDVRAAQRVALETRDADYRSILDSMTDVFYRTDQNGRIVMVSPSIESLLGYSPEEAIGRSARDFYCVPMERDNFIAAMKEADGRIRDREVCLMNRYGNMVWVSISAHFRYDAISGFDGTEGTIRDITGRKQSEEDLRILAERLSLASSAGGIGIWDCDLVTGAHVWDSRMCELYGVPANGLADARAYWKEAVHPDDMPRVNRELNDTLAGKREFHSTFRVVWPDGSLHHIESHGIVHRGDDGRPRRVVGVNREVTEQVEAERRLMKSQKLEAVGQLTGGVAHDFNNLLAVILGNLEFMGDYLDPGTKLETLKNGALKATLRGAELTQRLLAFSRRQTLSPSRVDANELVTELIELMRRTLGENIEIECDLSGRIDKLLIDPGQLENALLNLAINARDAMPDGGRLRIETANAILGPETGDEVSAPGPYVMVSISDTGTGMSSNVRDRIFEPFFTTKETGKGSGLGLSMVYGFVRQSGGHVIVDSEEGEGTTIKLYLPRAKGERRRVRISRPQPAEQPRGTEFVLVVEDDHDVREFLTGSLERLGYRVSAAADGPTAVAKLDQLPPLDLLITDVVMPKGMNGMEVADIVRDRHPGVRILYTSGYAENAVVESGDGASFLAKPYKRAVLAQTVRQLLDAA